MNEQLMVMGEVAVARRAPKRWSVPRLIRLALGEGRRKARRSPLDAELDYINAKHRFEELHQEVAVAMVGYEADIVQPGR